MNVNDYVCAHIWDIRFCEDTYAYMYSDKVGDCERKIVMCKWKEIWIM